DVGNDDDLEILEESSYVASKKRRRMDQLEDDDIESLKARVEQLEKEKAEIKTQRDYFERHALAHDPQLKPSRVHIHNVLADMKNISASFRSPPYEVDGVEISVFVKETVACASVERHGGTPEATVIPRITMTADDGIGRFVFAMVAVCQSKRQVLGKVLSPVECTLILKALFDKQGDIMGKSKTFTPITDLDSTSSFVSIRITMVVQRTDGMLPSPATNASDSATIRIDEKDIIVSIAYLSQWSKFFRAYFAADMAEKITGIYPIKDTVSAEDFEEMMRVISPAQKSVSLNNYEMLLKAAERFEMPDLTRRVEMFLLDFCKHKMRLANLFQLAIDVYNLELVQAKLLHRWRNVTLMKNELLAHRVYKELKPATKILVNQRFAEDAVMPNDSMKSGIVQTEVRAIDDQSDGD
ncbi:hypothetical protein PMAYCL1PPCAC_28118, partial [Pristionchus mayeri]